MILHPRLLPLLLVPWFCGAAEIPDAILPEGVGLNIHFTRGHVRELDQIHAGGFKFIRMDFAWKETEPQPGRYDWSAHEELLRNLDHRGIRAILILDYSHPAYEQEVTAINPMDNKPHQTTAAPQRPESIRAFVRWASAAAQHFKGRHVLWEIWNEPNVEFWSPVPDVQQYTTLAVATAQAIRAVDPSATIIGPASSEFPWDFLEQFFKSPILNYLDAVSVHPYRKPDRPPESATEDFQRLRQLIDQYAPAGKKLPILSGEWGYSTWTKGVNFETQAAFAVRQQLNNLLNGIPLSIWYDWMNDGTNPNEKEENWGTVFPNLKPKPAYIALRTMNRTLAGFRISYRLPLASPDDYLLVCTNAARHQKLAAWTTRETHSIRVDEGLPRRGKIRATDWSEAVTRLKVSDGSLELSLTRSPQYLDLGRAVGNKR